MSLIMNYGVMMEEISKHESIKEMYDKVKEDDMTRSKKMT